jgi:adenylate cyclase
MNTHDTARMNDQAENSQIYTRQLRQHLQELAATLQDQQELLRQYGMGLSTAAQEAWQALDQTATSFATQTQEIQFELRSLHALAETTQVINSTLELDEVLARVMDTVIQLTGAERGFIMLRHPGSDELEFRAARGLDREQLQGDQLTVSQTIINQVVTSREPTITDNASNDPRFQGQQSIVGFALRSIMAVPLMVHAEVIGVVYCDNRIFSGLFNHQDLQLLTDFANQAATAIQNARLYEDARARLAEMRENSELLSNVLDSIVSGVITIDAAGVVSSCNEAAADMFGLRVTEIEGQPLVAALLTDELANALVRVQNLGAQETLQLEPYLNDQRYWNLILSPLRDSGGAIQGVAMVLDDLTEIREHTEQLAQARRYLPAALVNNLRDIDIAGVRGEERLITAFSTDVRGFTTFSELLEPEELMEIINKYLSLASDAISFYKGVVDKFMGDAVTGLFNTQLNPQDDHAVRAVRAAMSLMSDLRALHEVMSPEQRLYYGIGIHTGAAVLGNVGSDNRKEFAAIGDATDVSKILESNARKGEVVISQATYDLVHTFFECEAFTPEKTQGRSDLTVAYRVLRQIQATGPVSLDDFEF